MRPHALTALLLGGMAALTPGTPRAVEADAEARLKAGFVYNFTKYAEWPAEVGPAGIGTLNVCVPPDTDLARSPLAALQGQTSQGVSIAVLARTKALENGRCHVLWIPRGEESAIPELLRLSARSKALTVGDIPGFLDAGGVIELVKVDDRIRFDVNLAAARRAGLRFSSHLLKLARNVRESDNRP
jgi:hypothetical protein